MIVIKGTVFVAPGNLSTNECLTASFGCAATAGANAISFDQLPSRAATYFADGSPGISQFCLGHPMNQRIENLYLVMSISMNCFAELFDYRKAIYPIQ